MHYTSIENIHKVIDPLFLDDLKAEFAELEGQRVLRNRAIDLVNFQKKLSEIRVLDPACGSGNFLTETYLSLRALENRVLESLNADAVLDLGEEGEGATIRVTIDQLFGIEVNDFAVAVAKTALWIAEAQMADRTAQILWKRFDVFPLRNTAHIECANALRTDWNDILPAEECNYIIGNPPFYGSSMCSDEQKQEIVDLFTQGGTEKVKLANSLDYVSGWYYKACQMMKVNEQIRAAFVSTNSITQGEQVYPIWNTLFDRFGIEIDFAWKTFVWNSEATDKAHVHVVVIGFSKHPQPARHSERSEESPEAQRGRSLAGARDDGKRPKLLFEVGGGTRAAERISPYLIDAQPVIPMSRKRPLCDVPALSYGNKPTDNGLFVLADKERDELLARAPQAAKFIREYVGAKEYLNGQTRWCMWLLGADKAEFMSIPEIAERVEGVRAFREASSAKDTRKRAETPWEFFRTPVHDVQYMAVPRTSSENRRYLPIGFFGADTIPSDATSVIPEATFYQFGILESQFHNAWMRIVAGRLESRYRYSGDVVYNNFIWPNPAAEQREEIERCARAALDARKAHPDRSLAEMYDGISPLPENPSKADLKKYDQREYDDLKAAHQALDAAVEAAYGVNFNGDEEKIVAHLFNLYAEAVDE